MASGNVEIVKVFDHLPGLGARARAFCSRQVRTQGLTTETDIKVNITTFDLIDTNAMRETTASTMTGEFEAEVGPSAQSDEGYPYPVAQNYGTATIPATGFADLAAEKARREFPQRFNGFEQAVS